MNLKARINPETKTRSPNNSPPPRGNSSGSSNNSPLPPPISSSYYPNMLLTLSHGNPENVTLIFAAFNVGASPAPMFRSRGRKWNRTKFTQFQKDKMLELADRVCWKMQKRDEDLIQESCRDIVVEKGVFKVWMHNNKNTLGKKDQNQPEQISTSTPASANTNRNIISHGDSVAYGHHWNDGSGDDIKSNIVDGRETCQFHLHDISNVQGLGTNGSSSST